MMVFLCSGQLDVDLAEEERLSMLEFLQSPPMQTGFCIIMY